MQGSDRTTPGIVLNLGSDLCCQVAPKNHNVDEDYQYHKPILDFAYITLMISIKPGIYNMEILYEIITN